MQTILRRAQIGKAHGIDTTVKSAVGLFRAFAPTWEMVMGFKQGTLPWERYVDQYRQLLEAIAPEVWDCVFNESEQVLMCYCRDSWPCHTYLILEYAATRWPDRVSVPVECRSVNGRPIYASASSTTTLL